MLRTLIQFSCAVIAGVSITYFSRWNSNGGSGFSSLSNLSCSTLKEKILQQRKIDVIGYSQTALAPEDDFQCESDIPWRNWIRSVNIRPPVTVYPVNERHVQLIVAAANTNGWRVRPIGSGHSHSQLTHTDQILMRTDEMVWIVNQDLYVDLAKAVGVGQRAERILSGQLDLIELSRVVNGQILLRTEIYQRLVSLRDSRQTAEYNQALQTLVSEGRTAQSRLNAKVWDKDLYRSRGDIHDYFDNKGERKLAVTVGSGLKIIALASLLQNEGGNVTYEGETRYRYALANFGSIQGQSIAGAVSTNTHGTGRNLTGFAGSVLALRIVIGDGSVKLVSADSPSQEDRDLFYSALSGGGMTGAITQITLKIVENYFVLSETKPIRLANLFNFREDRFKEANRWTFEQVHIGRSQDGREVDERGRIQTHFWDDQLHFYDWFSFLWILESDADEIEWTTAFRAFNVEDRGNNRRQAGRDNVPMELAARAVLAPVMTDLYVKFPQFFGMFIPPAYSMFRFIDNITGFDLKEGPSALSSQSIPSEWAFNLETEFYIPVHLLPKFIFEMKKYKINLKSQHQRITSPFMGIRFVKGDDSFLSPAYKYHGFNLFAAISIFDVKRPGQAEDTQFLKDMKAIMLRIANGDRRLVRMHIGKIYMVDQPNQKRIDDTTCATWGDCFGETFENWPRFAAARRRADPNGVFLNHWTEKFFQPVNQQ